MKYLLILLALFSCVDSKESSNGVQEGTETTLAQVQAEKNCGESFSKERTQFEVTGYKFNDKVGVKGTFKDWTLNAKKEFSSIEDLLKGAEFSFVEKSLDFGKTARNRNILSALFNNISGDEIKGKITEVNKSNETLSANLDWGGMNHSIKMVYSYLDGVLELNGEIDLIQIGFGKAFSALEKLCKVYHMKDGVSKTWSVVDVKVTSLLKNTDC